MLLEIGFAIEDSDGSVVVGKRLPLVPELRDTLGELARRYVIAGGI